MPYDNPGSDEEYFSDGPPMKEKDGMDDEGLLPKSLMAGKQFAVGDEIVLEITRIGEKDFSVKYATGKEEKEEKPKDDMMEKETADMGGGGGSETDSMMY